MINLLLSRKEVMWNRHSAIVKSDAHNNDI
jgi:hypothetical protein